MKRWRPQRRRCWWLWMSAFLAVNLLGYRRTVYVVFSMSVPQLVAHHLFCFHHIIISYSPCFVYHFHHLLSYSYCWALWRGSVWIINSNFCILTYSHIWRLFVDSLVFGEPMFSSSCWFVVFCGQHLFICPPPFHVPYSPKQHYRMANRTLQIYINQIRNKYTNILKYF